MLKNINFSSLANLTVAVVTMETPVVWVAYLKRIFQDVPNAPVFTGNPVNADVLLFNTYPNDKGQLKKFAEVYPTLPIIPFHTAYDERLTKEILANFDGELAYAKYLKRIELEVARDTACYLDVPAHNTHWQADKRSQELLTSALTLANLGMPLPAVWRDANNVDMPIATVTELLIIAGAMATQTQAAYTKSWQLKEDINTATTAEQLQDIVW